MRGRNLLALVAALGLGGVAVVGVNNILTRHTSGPASDAPVLQSSLVVARTTLTFGTRLKPENLTTIPWPTDRLPAGGYRTVDDLFAGGAQRVVLKSFEENEPILEGKISGPDGRGILSVTIEPGMRALSIRVNDIYGVAGFVLPGDRVDIMLIRTEAQDKARNDVLLQNVKVLAIDQDANDRAEGTKLARAVTLEVNTEQAQKLALGASVGTLVLALRNQTSPEVSQTRAITVQDLAIGEAIVPTAQPVVATPAPRVRRAPTTNNVGIMRGLDRETVRVPRDAAPNTAPPPSRLPTRSPVPPATPAPSGPQILSQVTAPAQVASGPPQALTN